MMTAQQFLSLAQTAYGQRDYAEAITQARAVLQLQPLDQTALALLANSAMQLQDGGLAVEALSRLRALRPHDTAIARSLSRALNRRGHQRVEVDDIFPAIADWRAALKLWPDNVDAAFNLASRATGLIDDTEAIALLRRVLQQHSADLPALRLLLTCLRDVGDLDTARALLTLQPDGLLCSSGWRALSLSIADRSLAERCVTHAPGASDWTASAQSALATLATLRRDADANDLVSMLSHTQTIGQHSPSLRIALADCLSLPAVHANSESVSAARLRFEQGLSRLTATFDAQRLRQCAPRLAQLNWSNFLLAYQGEDDRMLQSRYGDWLHMAAGCLRPDLAEPPARRRPGPPRIGLLSGHWYRSTAGSYFSSWIDALNRAEWDTQVFALGPRFDAYTDLLAARSRKFSRLDDDIDTAADQVRAADLDLLIYPELGMDTRLLPLAALKLARQQWLAWGHPVSSGLPTMDAFLSCAAMEPDGADAHYRERLLRLPGLGTRYDLPEVPSLRSRAELGLPSGPLVVVPQSLFKIHPDNDLMVHELLDRQPDAHLLLFCGDSRLEPRILRERLETRLGARLASRMLWHPMVSRERFLQILASADLMLDTLHWSGGNTTLDALRAGLPVVTTPSRFMRGRQSAAMLQAMGCAASIAADPAALPALAVAFLQAGKDAPRPRTDEIEAYAMADAPLKALVALAQQAVAGVV